MSEEKPIEPKSEEISTESIAEEKPQQAPDEIPTKPMRGVFGGMPEPKFESVAKALEDRFKQLQKTMLIDEDLMMTYLAREEIHEAYFKLWRDDANKILRCLCAAKRRLKKAKESEKKAG